MNQITISEKDFTKQVIDLAHLHGWLVAHFRTAMTKRGNYMTPVQADGKGFPDLVLVSTKQSRVIFAELKAEKGKLSPAQSLWLNTLEFTPMEVYVWRPSDFDEINRILSPGARKGTG